MKRKIRIVICLLLLSATNIFAQIVDVWPGDANGDKIVNCGDLIYIGLGYGSGGPARANASLNWAAQPITAWGDYFANGTDISSLDCDGNGIINADDTLAILANYNFIHAKKGEDVKYVTGVPDLYFDFPADSALAGTTLQVPIYYGTSSVPVDSIYGLAFTINYSMGLVDSSSLSVNFDNSWMGTTVNNNLISLRRNMYPSSKMDVAVTRTNQANISGYGQIGTLNITMKDDLSGKMFLAKKLKLSVSDVTALTVFEKAVPVNVLSDSVIVWKDVATTINKTNNFGEQILKTCIRDSRLYFSWGQETGVWSSVVDLFGKQYFVSAEPNLGEKGVPLSGLSAGVYFLIIKNTKGVEIVKKIVIASPGSE